MAWGNILDSILKQKRDRFFMSMAHFVAGYSSCIRLQIGAVLVGADGKLISIGYNGVPDESIPCGYEGKFICPKMASGLTHEQGNQFCIGNHAEQVALQNAPFTVGTTLYTTVSPCLECTRLIVNAGIKRVVFAHKWGSPLPDQEQKLSKVIWDSF